MSTGRDIAVTLTADSRGFGRGVKSARDDLSALRETVDSVKTALVGFLSISAIKGFVGGLTDTVGKIDDLAAQADRLGVSTEFLSELEGAAKLSDTEIDSLNQGLLLMEKSLGKAGLRGEDTEETFLKIADSVAAMNDPMERAAYVTEIFGKSGQSLIGILSRGRAGIQDLRNEVRSLGGSIGDDMADKAGLADDAVKRLTIAWDGLKNTLAIDLAPALTSVLGGLTDIARGMKDTFGPILKSTLELLGEFRDNLEEIAFVGGKLFEGSSLTDAFRDLEAFRRGRDDARNQPVLPRNKAGAAGAFEFPDKTKIELKNPALDVNSKEGFSALARALRGPSQNIPQQQLAEQKKGNQKLDDIKNAVKDIKLPPVAPDF